MVTLVMVGGDGIVILVERFGLLNCFFFGKFYNE